MTSNEHYCYVMSAGRQDKQIEKVIHISVTLAACLHHFVCYTFITYETYSVNIIYTDVGRHRKYW